MNRFAAMKEFKPSEKRTELALQLGNEATAVAALGTAQTKAIAAEDAVANAPARLAEIRQQEEANHQNLLVITEEATRLKVTPLVLDEIRRDEERSKIRVNEKRDLDRLDIERRWIELEQDLKAGFIFAQKEYQYLQLFRQYLNGLYEERKLLEASSSLAKDDQLKLINTHIRAMEKDFREQQKRLLQAPTRKELPRSDEDTQSE